MVAYAEPLPQLEVFVVDSDPASRDELAQGVHNAGFAARTLATASEALAQFPFRRPAIVLMQLAMHDMDAVTLCGAIRKHTLGRYTRLVCMGTIAADLRPMLRDRYEAMFMPTSQMRELLMPALRLLACESVAMPKERRSAFAVNYALVEDFVAECRHNVSAGALYVESDTIPARGEIITVNMRIPHLEYDLHLAAKVVTLEQFNHRDRVGRGFGVQLCNLPKEGCETLCQVANTLEHLRRGSDRRGATAAEQQWLLVVDPSERLMTREFGFLNRNGLATAAFASLETACDFATSNNVAWMGIAEPALANQPAAAADAMLSILIGSIGDVAILAEKHGEATLSSTGVLHTSARDMADILAQRFDIAVRRSVRVRCPASARVEVMGQPYDVAVVDLSRSGLLVRCNKPLPDDVAAMVTVSVADRDPIRGRGLVVRTVAEASGTYLVGLALFDLKAYGKLALDHLVVQHLAATV